MNAASPNPRSPGSAGVSAVLALVLAIISFFALTIGGLGFLSLLTETDIISVPGLGQLPGVLGMLAAVAIFALLLGFVLRASHPSYFASIGVALATALVHLGTIWITASGTGDGPVSAGAVVGQLVLGGASALITGAAFIAAWGGIALRRTHAQHPQWPWEKRGE